MALMAAAKSPVVGYVASSLMTATSPCNMPMCEKCRGIIKYVIVHPGGIEMTYYGCCGTHNHVNSSCCKKCGKINQRRWCQCNFWDKHSPDTWFQSAGSNVGLAVGVPVAYTYGIPLGMQCGTAIIGGTLGATIGMVLIPALIVVQCQGQGVKVARKTERVAGEAYDVLADGVSAGAQAIVAGGEAVVHGTVAGVNLLADGVSTGAQAIVAGGEAAVETVAQLSDRISNTAVSENDNRKENSRISDEEIQKIGAAIRSNASLVKDRQYWGMTYTNTVCGGPGGIVEWLSSTEGYTKEQAHSICQRLVDLNVIRNTDKQGGPFKDDKDVWFEFFSEAPSSQDDSYLGSMASFANQATSMANDAAQAIANNETVQNAVEASTKKIAAVVEDANVQAAIEGAQVAATTVIENEKVQEAITVAKETATAVAESETVQLLAEQTVEGFYAAKDMTAEAALQVYNSLEELAKDETVQSTLSNLCGNNESDLRQHVVHGSLPKYFVTDQVVLVNNPEEEGPHASA